MRYKHKTLLTPEVITSILAIARNYKQEVFLARLICFVSCSGRYVSFALLAGMHTGTIIVAHSRQGLVAAVITALLPVIAETYWLVILCLDGGILPVLYVTALVGVVAISYLVKGLEPVDIHVHNAPIQLSAETDVPINRR